MTTERDRELDALLAALKQRTHFFQPPENFDPLAANPDQLQEFGLPPLPDRVTRPSQFAFWQRLYSPPLRFVKAEFSFLLSDFRLNHRGPLPALGTRYETSPNWSGAYITPKHGRMFIEVHGSWQVPTPSPPVSRAGGAIVDGDYRSSTWIGLDGQRRYLDSSLPQIGTNQFVKVVNGQATADTGTWWQWWLRGQKNPPITLPLAVKPGHLVMCSLVLVNRTKVRFFIKNETTGDFVSPFEEATPSPQVKVSGATAEWVVERPTHLHDDGLYELPDYNTVLFSNCLAVAAYDPESPSQDEILPGAKLINMFEVRENPHRIADVSVAELEQGEAVATFYR